MSRLILCVAVFLSASVAQSDTAVPGDSARGVACVTVADCWLGDDGRAIKRPARLRGRKLPRGDCGRNLLWLRHHLSCEQHQCVAKFIGDKC